MVDDFGQYVAWIRQNPLVWEFADADESSTQDAQQLFTLLTQIQTALQTLPRYIHPQAKVHASAQIEGNVVIEDGAQVLANTQIVGPSFLGRNAVVGNFSFLRTHCFLSRDALVGNHCYCNEVVLGRSSRVAHFVNLSRSLIGFNSSVSAFVITATVRADKRPIPARNHQGTTAKVGSVVGNNAFIAPYALLLPGVAVGNRSFVGSFSIVGRDVPDDTYLETTQRKRSRANTVSLPRRRKAARFLATRQHGVQRRYAGVLLIGREGQFILQRRDRKAGTRHPGMLSAFGGRLRTNEEAAAGAARELSEETGFLVEQDQLRPLLETVFSRDDGSTTLCTLYVLENVNHEDVRVAEGRGYEIVSQDDAMGLEDLTDLCRTGISECFKRTRTRSGAP